jgi:hypothetical protein
LTIRIAQAVYELKTVDQQVCDLLETTAHIDACMSTVRLLRRQKSAVLHSTLKIWIDRVIIDADKAVQNVAALIEPARIDMRTNFGKVSLKNKFAFVLRNSSQIKNNLHKLNIIHQSLNSAMMILSASIADLDNEGGSRPIGNVNTDHKPPPAYGEINQLRRERKKSISSFLMTRSPHDSTSPDSPFGKEIYELDSEPVKRASVPTPVAIAQQEPPKSGFTPDDGLIPLETPDDGLMPVEDRGELPSPPIDPSNSHRKNLYMDGADGPQVVMSDLPEFVGDLNGVNMDSNSRMHWQFTHLPPRSTHQSRPDSLLTCNARTGSVLSNHIPLQLLPGQASPGDSRNPSYLGSSTNSTVNHHMSYTPPLPSDPELFLHNIPSTTSLASTVHRQSVHNPQSPPQATPTHEQVQLNLQPPTPTPTPTQTQTQTRPQIYTQHTQPQPDTSLENNASRVRGRPLSGKERREKWMEYHANR